MRLHNIDYLSDERKMASFPVRQLTYFMDGGEDETKLREKIMLEFERDPDFKVSDFHDLPRAEIRERIMRRLKNFRHYILTDPVDVIRTRMNILTMLDPGFMTRIGVHLVLFLRTITSNGSDEQRDYWLGKGPVSFGITGCFAMTELGHGSNVAGLETIATFDPESDEFVIHSPTLTATKFWIGGAAETATHS